VLFRSTCLNSQDKLEFYCKKHNHKWKAAPYSIRQGKWCKFDGYEKSAEKNRSKITISDMQLLAKKYKGECLSNKYLGQNVPLTWKCKDPSHPPFKATPAAVKNGTFCLLDTKKARITIEDMIIHAKKHGGKCVTEKLDKKGQTIVEFECAIYPEHPHFFKKATYIKNDPNLWCPQDEGGKIQKYDIQYVKEITKRNGCECLSDKYINTYTLMKWRCLVCNYIFTSNLKNLKKKDKIRLKWCDKCNALDKLRKNSQIV
jgi:hypothetical protein